MTKAEENPEYKEFIIKQNKKNFLRCFWPGGRCMEKAIRAHSIQNSRVLASIAERGDVIMLRAKQDFDSGPKVRFESIGKNNATTFTGLCQKHDDILFKPIEKAAIDLSSEEHLFLLAYRAILRELHSKMKAAIDFGSIYEKGCKDGKFDPRIHDVASQSLTMKIAESYSCYRYKFSFDVLYRKKLFDQVSHAKLSVKSDKPIIAVSSVYDVFNNMRFYQDRMDPKVIALNILPLNEYTHIIFSFRKDHEETLRPSLAPILSATGHYQLYLISKLVLRHCENFVISPGHFRTFSPEKIEAMTRYFSKNMFARKEDYDDENLYLF